MKNLKDNWIAGLIVFIALVLRLPLLTGSFWLDEAAQALESARPLSQQLEITPDFQPPLLHLLLHVATWFSTTEWWLRTVGALIPGIITVWLTYEIGKRYLSQSAGVVAGLLLATSSFHIFYSQELRQYALPAVLAVLSWKVILSFKETSQFRQWLAFGVISSLGLYSSYLYPFLFLSQVVWLMLSQRSQLKALLITILGIVLSFLPWLPSFSKQLAAGGEVRVLLPGWDQVVSIPQLKSLPLVLAKFLFGVVNTDLNFLFLAVTAVFGALLILSAYFISDSKRQVLMHKYVWLGIWLVLPLLLAWLVSFWIPVVQPKRVLYLLPAFYLLIAAVAHYTTKRMLAVALVGLVLLLNVGGTVQYYLNPIYQRENWRAAYADIASRYEPRQTIAVFVFPEPFAPWRWYNHQNFPSWTTGTLHIDQVENLTDRLKPVITYEYVIVFDYLSDLSDPQRRLLQELEAFGYESIDLIQYPNLGFVRIYARRGAAQA